MLYAGTSIVGGRAEGVVVATGVSTELGRIAGSLAATGGTRAPLIVRIERLSRWILLGMGVGVGLLVVLLVARGAPSSEIFFLAVALAVSAVPEGLPVAITVALAVATRRMAERNVIVRTLPAVEGLGACTHIASDKTGTLTQNRLSVERVVLPDGTGLN